MKARAQGGFVVVVVVAVVVVVIPLPGLTLNYLRPKRVNASARRGFAVVVVVAVIALTNPHLKVVWAKHTPSSHSMCR